MKTSEFISWTKPRLSRTIYRSRGVPWPNSGVMIFQIFTFFCVFVEKSITNNEHVQNSDFFAPAGKLTGGSEYAETTFVHTCSISLEASKGVNFLKPCCCSWGVNPPQTATLVLLYGGLTPLSPERATAATVGGVLPLKGILTEALVHLTAQMRLRTVARTVSPVHC